jgi:glycosyltransferase involved in cell wall biosynthesis
MIVGFDISQTWRWKAGCGYFADSLMKAIASLDADNEYVLYPTFGDGVWDPTWPGSQPPVHNPRVRLGFGHQDRTELEEFWRSPVIDENLLGNPDVIHCNNFYCPDGISRARLVYTLYDLGFVDHPEWTTEANRTTCFSGVFNASLYADRIVAISEYSRQHFLRTFPHYPAERTSVVHPASRFSSDSQARDLAAQAVPGLRPDGFWLSVATLEPRKNHRGLLEAYARLRAQQQDVLPLVLVGQKGWLMDDFDREVEKLGLRASVIRLGYVDDATLKWLYANCFAFVYVSFFEGFGLPPLEAMSCGAPVVCSNTTSLPEVAGDAGVLVDPWDPAAISAAMEQISRGDVDRETLRERARERAQHFTWRGAARCVQAIYDELGRAGECG